MKNAIRSIINTLTMFRSVCVYVLMCVCMCRSVIRVLQKIEQTIHHDMLFQRSQTKIDAKKTNERKHNKKRKAEFLFSFFVLPIFFLTQKKRNEQEDVEAEAKAEAESEEENKKDKEQKERKHWSKLLIINYFHLAIFVRLHGLKRDFLELQINRSSE